MSNSITDSDSYGDSDDSGSNEEEKENEQHQPKLGSLMRAMSMHKRLSKRLDKQSTLKFVDP